MKQHKTFRVAFGISCFLRGTLCALLGTFLLIPLPASAIVGGEGVDPDTSSSPWAGVGSVIVNGSTFSGVLISPNYVLTAAHVVFGVASDPSSVTFQINAGRTMQISARKIFVNPKYTGAATLDRTVPNDLAIIELRNSVPPEIPHYKLDNRPLKVLQTLTFVGYGAGGNGDTKATIPADAATKRIGKNNIDLLLHNSLGPAVYMFGFDGPTVTNDILNPSLPSNYRLGANVEATFGTGDSGSPGFVRDPHGRWEVAVINTFVGQVSRAPPPSLFGSVGGGIVVAPYVVWIDSVISAPVSAGKP